MHKISIILLVSVLFVLLFSITSAQQNDQPIVGTPWRGEDGITVSVQKLIDMEKAAPKKPFAITARREHEVDLEPEPNPLAPAVSGWPPISKQDQNQLQGAGLFSPQTVGASWLGIQVSETPGYVPPDIVGDVGPTQVLVHVNGYIKVFNKSGTVGSLNVSDNTFWASVRGADDVSDPHVRYDPISQRWYLCIITIPNGVNKILIAVSSGPTITNTSSFTFFGFQQDAITPVGSDAGGFADYPTLGVDANALYIGTNMFNGAGTAFLGCSAFVVRKSALLTGSLVVTVFREICTSSGAGPYTPQGVHNDDPTATEGYFIGSDGAVESKLDIRRVSNPGGTPTLSGNLAVTVPTTSSPILQPAKGSTHTLDALDERLFAAQLKKNKLTGVVSLWTAHNIQVDASGVATTSNGRNASRWYELTNLTTTPTLRQSGTVFSSAASNPDGYWIPSVAMSGQGHMALGCSYAGVNNYTGIAIAGRLSTDVLSTTQAVTNALVGTAAYNAETSNGQRWGDFTQTVVDPTDDMTMWTFQEYANSTNSWALRVIKLVAPAPATPSSVSPSSVNTGVSNVNLTLTGTSTSGTGFFDPGTGFTGRLAASVSGTGVTVNSVTFTDATHMTVNVTVAANATSGTRTITVTNPDGQTATSATAILTINNVSCPTITLSPSTLPTGDKGGAYSQTITASGGVASYTYTLTGGALPTGITLSSGGVVSGTPTVAGTFLFTVTATDANSCTGSRQDTLTINACPTITVLPASLTNGSAGSAYNQTITSSGGVSAYSYTVTAGTLPAGVTLTTGGVLSGTPTYGGTYNFTITSNDAHSCTGTKAYTFVVTGCPQITLSPTSLPSSISGASYNQTITASGGKTPYTYSLASGALPVGFSLSSGGAITGSSTTLGTANFTVTATDSNLCTASKTYSIAINNCPTITISPSTLPNGTIGTAYNQTITSSGGTAAYTYSVTVGILPTGLTLTSGGVLSGTPTTVGSSSVTVQSSDANGCSVTKAYTIQINCPTITISPSTLPSGTLNVAYSQTITSSGGTSPYTDSVTVGTLPAGLTLSSGGVLSGTPTATGSSSFTVQSTDAHNCTATLAYTLQINALSGNFISLVTSGVAYTQDFNTMPSSGTTDTTLPGGWAFKETGSSANTTYAIGAGTSNSGGAYDFGSTSSSDRALGGIQSGNVAPFWGAGIVNNTGATITSLQIAYTCEQWRVGLASRTVPDTIKFQLALDATSISTGTWTKYDSLYGYSPKLSTTQGALDGNVAANRKTISYTISGLSIANGSPFFIRWVDADISSSDDGLAVDDFSITPFSSNTPTNPTIAVSATPDTVNVGNTTLLKATVGAGTNPASTGLAVTADLSTIGGSASQTFYDDGTHGDVTIGDNIFSFSATVTGATGLKSLPFTVTDAQSRSNNATLSLLVTVPGCATITVSPSTLPAGSVGSAYTQTITASGGKIPYTFALLNAGTLPAGLSLATNGAITGTLTTAATSNFTVIATDSSGCTGSKTYSVTVTCATITVAPTTLVAGTTGSAYSQTVTASGGKTPYSFAVTTGILPTGLSLATTGELTGTPSVAGSSSITITATDSNGCTGLKTYTIQVTAPFATISLTTAGSAYTQDFNTLAMAGTSSTLPTGWSLYETGASQNTVYTAGNGSLLTGDTYSFGIDTTASDRALGGLQSGNLIPSWGAGFTNNTGATITSLIVSYNGEEWRSGATTRTAADTIAFQLSTDATSITGGTWTTYSALNFTSPFVGTVATALDGNASANRANVNSILSGLSIPNGSNFFIRWSDVNVTGADDGLAVDDFSITPNTGATPTNPSVTANATPDTVVAGNSTLITATVTPGANPTSSGVTVTGNLTSLGGSATQTLYDDATHGDAQQGDNIFSYTATVPANAGAGLRSVSFNVADAQSRTASTTLSVLVNRPPCPTITLLPASLPGDTIGRSYSQTVTASGGQTPYTYAVTAGSLPSGLSLSSGGALTGTLSATGTFSFTITATDSFACTGTKAYTVTIYDALTNVTVGLASRWNIVSNPLIMTNDSVQSMYPGATSSAFAFTSTGYQSKVRLENGVGYWLKFGSASNFMLHGKAIVSDTVDVLAGWNIIGSVTHAVLASSVTSIPGGIQTGNFFKYNDGYVSADTIIPGKGYWVKVTQAGKLILSSSSILAANRIQITPTGEMPPAPPEGLSNNNPVIPSEFSLEQNYPNPFNPTTNFSFHIPDVGTQRAVSSSGAVSVQLKVYNTLGKEIATIINQEMNPGSYTIQWDASGIPSGVYYYRMTSGQFSDMKKLLLMK